jgi:hypothetical protein
MYIKDIPLSHNATENATHFLPHHPGDHPHDDLVHYSEELDNHVRLCTHRAEYRPKYETEEDNP